MDDRNLRLVRLAEELCVACETLLTSTNEESGWDDTAECLQLYDGDFSGAELLDMDLSWTGQCLSLLPDVRQPFAFAVLVLYERKNGGVLVDDALFGYAEKVASGKIVGALPGHLELATLYRDTWLLEAQ